MIKLSDIKDKILTTKNLAWDKRIENIANEFKGKLIFSSSFSIEDQIITHIIVNLKLDITIFTLDTGRMFDETYEVWQETKNKYGINIIPYYPNQDALKEFVENKGINSFYDSKENRLECCGVRKIEPLKRALKSFDIWISGVRSAQSAFREDKEISEIDNGNDIVKFYPILELSDKEIWDFIKQENIPYNKLYDKGFTSIGCAPCTRVPTDPNDPRSGRWWWEIEGRKECGLHLVDGKLVRKNN
ncbi:phosphoadenylyl-sulfate reductase [Rickettsiales bacterium]|nr:phosphoadenylyl-sulfate reductase [Rickettsiales bacterium]